MSKAGARQQLNRAIKDLREARHFLNRNRFETAENDIGEALRFIGNAIRQINRAEKRP